MSNQEQFPELTKELKDLSDKGYNFYILLENEDSIYVRHNAGTSKELIQLGRYVEEAIGRSLSEATGLTEESIIEVITELTTVGIESLEDFESIYPDKYAKLPAPVIDYLKELSGEDFKYGLATASIINGVIDEPSNWRSMY